MAEQRERLLRKGDYVYGSFLKPEAVDGYINGVNPSDRSDVLGRFPFSEANADEAVDYAGIGARSWRKVSQNDRATAVRRYRDYLARGQERTARLICRETGKPLWEARQEVLATVRALDLFLDDGISLLAPRVIEEIGARSDRIPRGVVAVVAPHAFPLLGPSTNTAAALLSGNAVVFKPSKYTPATGQTVAELWDRCKLPRGAFNMVQGPGAVIGQRLVTNPGVDAVVFTGSYGTARTVHQLMQRRPELPVVYQCGGKGTAIVLDDAEIDRAVYEIVVGAFLSAGQRHNSTGRVLVTDAVYDAFIDALIRRTDGLVVGPAHQLDTFVGPLISEALRARYRRFARALTAAGQQALREAGHESPGGLRGFYARPAIYRIHWESGQALLDEEPPGPMLLVYRVSSWEEAVSLHNQQAFRIATSVFVHPESAAVPELRDRLRTGALNVNRGTIGASLRLPAVGLGRSSNGHGAGLDLLLTLTTPRSQLVESRPFEGLVHLPGMNWEQATDSGSEPDLSSALELAVE